MIVHENSYWNLSYAFWCRSWQFGLIDGVTVTTWIQAKRISYPRSLFVAICVNWWICCRDITLAHSTHKIWIFNMNSLSPYLSSYPCRARSVCVPCTELQIESRADTHKGYSLYLCNGNMSYCTPCHSINFGCIAHFHPYTILSWYTAFVVRFGGSSTMPYRNVHKLSNRNYTRFMFVVNVPCDVPYLNVSNELQ